MIEKVIHVATSIFCLFIIPGVQLVADPSKSLMITIASSLIINVTTRELGIAKKLQLGYYHSISWFALYSLIGYITLTLLGAPFMM